MNKMSEFAFRPQKEQIDRFRNLTAEEKLEWLEEINEFVNEFVSEQRENAGRGIQINEVITMFPGRRKRDWNPEDDFFRGLDEEFREMEEHIARMFSEMGEGSPEQDEQSGPYIYGFSMRVGPEGKPRIEEFGNIPNMISQRTETPGEREPLTDIIEGDKEITIVMELPGIDKKDINLNVAVDSLEIDVDTPERQYHKKLALPCEVKSGKTRATYKNGVLEVKIERVAEKEEIGGVRVEVE